MYCGTGEGGLIKQSVRCSPFYACLTLPSLSSDSFHTSFPRSFLLPALFIGGLLVWRQL